MDEKDFGEVRISDDVVETIASIAASQIPGVADLTGGSVGDFMDKFNKKKHNKGVKVDVKDRSVSISLNVLVDFGVNVVETCEEIQKNVKQQVELMTGLNVESVNISVVGIKISEDAIPKENKN